MSSANQMAKANGSPEAWRSLLELASREVFEIMLASKLEARGEADALPLEFTAMVGLAGQLCGVLSLRCSTASAGRMASKMLGIDLKEVDAQMWDAIGEIANMIAGNFKNKLTGLGDGCMLSVPTVITGSDYSYRSLSGSDSVEVAFLFEGAPITVALEVHS